MAGEKKIIEQQAYMLNALDKIEEYSEYTADTLEQIAVNISEDIIKGQAHTNESLDDISELLRGYLDVTKEDTADLRDNISSKSSASFSKISNDNIVNSNVSIINELQQQTNVLNSILTTLGGKPVDTKTTDIEKTKSKSAIKGLSDDVDSSNAMSFAKILVVLGAAFWAFGKGIGSMTDISFEKIAAFSAIMLTVFGAISLIYKDGIDLSIGQAIELSIISVMLAMMVTDVARIMSKMEMPSMAQLGMGVLIAATMIPIALHVVKTMDELNAFSGGAIMDLIEAPILMLASMGALIMMPMIALAIVATANILRMMPKKLDASSLAMAMAVSLAMLPMAHVFVLIFRALRGPAGSARLMGAVASRIATGATNPLGVIGSAGAALLIIPLVALAIVATAWIFKALPDKFKIPPMAWIAKVGIIMVLFSWTLKALQGVASLSKTTTDETGKIKGGRGKFAKLIMGMFLMSASIVAVAWIFKALPNKYKAPPLEWTISIGLAMLMFAKSISVLLSVFAGKDNSSAFGMSKEKIGFKEVIVATIAIIMLSASIVAVAHIMNLLPSENSLKAPPLSWIIKVGLALFIFGKAIGAIISAFKGGGMKDKLFGSSGKVTTKDILNVSVSLAVLALTVVAIAYIMAALPPDTALKAPPISWTIKVGLSMLIFSKAMKNIIMAFGSRMSYKKVLMAGLLINILAMSIVTTSYIMMLLPPEDNLKAPPLMWTVKVGLAMWAFSKAMKNMAGALSKMSIKQMITSFVMLNLVALSIVSTAMIMQLLPDDLKAPSLSWTFKVGMGMILFGGAIFILSKAVDDFDDLITASAGIIMLSTLIVAIAHLYRGLPNEFKSPPLMWTISVGMGMILFSAAIFVLSKTNIKTKDIARSVLLLNTVALSMISTAWLFTLLPKEFVAPPIEWVLKSVLALTAFGVVFGLLGIGHKFIKRGAIAMSFAIGSVLMLSSAMYIWKESKVDVDDIITIGATILGVGVTMMLAGLVHSLIKKGAIAMLLATLPILSLAAAMIIWNKADVQWEDVAMLGVTVLTVGAIMAIAGIGPIPLFITLGALAMTVATLPIWSLALAMNIWTKADVQWEDVAILGASVLGLGTAMAAAGLASPFILLGSSAMLVAGLALMSIAKGVSQFAELYKKSPEIMDGVIISSLITNIVQAFNVPLKDTAKIYAVSPALILAGTSLIQIARGLQEFAAIDIDIDKLAIKISKVVMSVSDAFAKIGEKYGGSFLKKGPVAKGVAAVKGIGKQLIQIAKGVQAFANLTYIDENGKRVTIPASWLKPDGKIPMNIKNVLGVVGDVFAQLGRTNGEAGWFSRGLIEKGVDSIKGAGKELSRIAGGVLDFANLKYTINGKDTIIPEEDLLPGGKISRTIRNVLGVVGEVFAELGRTNGESGWFSRGMIEKGIDSIKGAGNELGSIAKAVIDFANLKYTLNGEEFVLTPDQIGVFNDKGEMVKPGSVYTNIRNSVLAITGVLAEVGANPDNANKWWAGKSNLEKGKKAIMGVTEGLSDIAAFITSIGTIEDMDTLEHNIRSILMLLPSALIDAYSVLEGNEDSAESMSLMLSKYPTELADSIERIAKHQTAMEKIAGSFGSIATSIGEMKDTIQIFDEGKLENLSTLFNSVRDIQKLEIESKSKGGVAADVSKGIEKGMGKVMDIIEKFSKKSDKQTGVLQKLADKEVKIPGTKVTIDNSDLINAMKTMIDKLESVNEKLIEVPVRVMNQDNSVQ